MHFAPVIVVFARLLVAMLCVGMFLPGFQRMVENLAVVPTQSVAERGNEGNEVHNQVNRNDCR